jgi:hypothetical protein
MSKYVLTFRRAGHGCTRVKIIEAETLADAKHIASEMHDADKPADDEFKDPEIMDRRDIVVTGVGELNLRQRRRDRGNEDEASQ